MLAFFDSSDAHHRAVVATVAAEPGAFIVSPFVLAELDYLLATRRGIVAELLALAEFAGGAWELPAFEQSDLQAAADLIQQYGDQDLGLADASMVVLAHRYQTDRLLTLDSRHFRVVKTITGKPFTLVPAA